MLDLGVWMALQLEAEKLRKTQRQDKNALAQKDSGDVNLSS